MRLALAATALAVALSAPQGAVADPVDWTEDDAREWRFIFAPYLFLPVSTSGTSTVAGREADIDLNLREVFDVLNFAASGRLEAWRGDFGLMIDGYYVNIGGDGSVSGLGPGGGLTAGGDIKTKQAYVSIAGAYRVAHGALDSGRRWAFDVGAGAKFNSLEQTADAAAASAGPKPGGSR